MIAEIGAGLCRSSVAEEAIEAMPAGFRFAAGCLCGVSSRAQPPMEEKMRGKMLYAGALALLCVATALAEDAPQLKLRGDRFRPLVYEEMTPEQKAMADHVLAGQRGSMNGPYNVLLRSPEMGDLAQKYGAYERYHSMVPHKLNEL